MTGPFPGMQSQLSTHCLSPTDDGQRVYVGRFAPTPSGRLHMGNLFAFLVGYLDAKQHQGRIVLRMEDLDPHRTSIKRADEMLCDLEWFGFTWDTPVIYQSQREEAYQEAFSRLQKQHLLYPCFCTRADLHSATAPHWGDEVIYPGTCSSLSREEQRIRRLEKDPSYRIRVPDRLFSFTDSFQGEQAFCLQDTSGDFVVKRSDGVYSYQLAVVVDDAAMGVTHVIRGVDLLTSAPRQRYLQECLGLSCVQYGHVPIIVDNQGKRLAKRNQDASLVFLKEQKRWSPERILGHISWRTGLIGYDEPCSLETLIREADLTVLYNRQTITWD